MFGSYLRSMSNCVLCLQLYVLIQFLKKEKVYLGISRCRYYFQESRFLFFKMKGLCEKNTTCSKSKEFWMPQICIFVTLKVVFAIHHDLRFFFFFFAAILFLLHNLPPDYLWFLQSLFNECIAQLFYNECYLIDHLNYYSHFSFNSQK